MNRFINVSPKPEWSTISYEVADFDSIKSLANVFVPLNGFSDLNTSQNDMI